MSLLSEGRWNLTAVVMAAGLSKRMGADKLQLPLNGKPLFTYVLELVAQMPFAARIIVTNQPEIAAYAKAHGLAVVPSPDAALGMGHSVAAGAQAVDKDTAGILFINADQPFVAQNVVEELCKVFAQQDKIIVPCVKGRPSSPCIFPMRFCAELCALTGDKGGRQVYEKHPNQTFFAEQDRIESFTDLDCPEDYLPYQKSDCFGKQGETVSRR